MLLCISDSYVLIEYFDICCSFICIVMLISWTAMYTINYSHTSSLHVLCNPMPDVSIGAMMCYAVRCHVFTLSRVLMSDSSTRSLTLPWRCLEVLTEPADFGVLSVSDLLVGERGSKRLPAIGEALSLWVFDRNVQSMQNSMEWVFPCSIPQSRHCADMHIWVWIEEIRSSFCAAVVSELVIVIAAACVPFENFRSNSTWRVPARISFWAEEERSIWCVCAAQINFNHS